MLTILCVLKSGGPDYDAEYVRKLRDGVAKHLKIEHRFVCLSDVDVPCERIEMRHDWPGWYSKIEMFKPGVITGPTLYLDLDSVIVGALDRIETVPYAFSMLSILGKGEKNGDSGAMWFAQPFPHVYTRFANDPQYWIDYHAAHANGKYFGDQAFISDCFDEIPKLHEWCPHFFKSYKWDKCQDAMPKGASVVCFGGKPRPHEAPGWVRKVWI